VAIRVSYAEAKADLEQLWDRAIHDSETVIISRRGAQDVALIAADELASLQATVHLIRSPANAAKLLTALNRALQGGGEPSTTERLRRWTAD
jgi:antitoxin YefM